MAKINKALDLNKLFTEQNKGKLLKKHMTFPMYGGIKYDGNYTVVLKDSSGITYITSGGHIYTNNEQTIFDHAGIPVGFAFLAERIGTDGHLGDRVNCSLRGTRGMQVAVNHKYMIHDMIPLEHYHLGKATHPYHERREWCRDMLGDYWVSDRRLHDQDEVEAYLKSVVSHGFEGIMLKSPNWYWTDTKSRKVDNVKYKKRPTADLLCIAVNEGTGKYEGMIGSLTLTDSKGRLVDVGSGMSDEERHYPADYFLREVVEIFYEQIIDTYIQPTFGDEYEGVLIRHDKSSEDID